MKYRLMGINADYDQCSCCGKKGLKKVAWLSPVDQDGNICGDPAPFGSTCAMVALGGGKLSPSKAEKTLNDTVKNSDHIVDLVLAYFHRGQLSKCAYNVPGRSFTHYYYTTKEIASEYESGKISIEEVFEKTKSRSAGVFIGDRSSHFDREENIMRWRGEDWFSDFEKWLNE